MQFVKAFTDDIEITLRVIGNKEEQFKTIDDMNMKYRFPIDTGTALVELVRVQVKIPAEDSESSDEEI